MQYLGPSLLTAARYEDCLGYYTTVKTTGACDANNHTRLRLLHIPFLYVNSLVPDPPTYCKISLVPRPQVPDGAWERGYCRIELGILRNVFFVKLGGVA